MLDGNAFFVDRETGETWCDSCVPAEVVHLAGVVIKEIQPRTDRYVLVESGELRIRLGGNDRAPERELRVRARCGTCEITQPLGATA